MPTERTTVGSMRVLMLSMLPDCVGVQLGRVLTLGKTRCACIFWLQFKSMAVCFWGFRTVTMYFAEPCRRGVGPVDGPLAYKVGIL